MIWWVWNKWADKAGIQKNKQFMMKLAMWTFHCSVPLNWTIEGLCSVLEKFNYRLNEETMYARFKTCPMKKCKLHERANQTFFNNEMAIAYHLFVYYSCLHMDTNEFMINCEAVFWILFFIWKKKSHF